jgi:hypothetical protein
MPSGLLAHISLWSLILGLGIFIFTISSFTIASNFRMWSLKILLWFSNLLVWYWGFVRGFQKIWNINVTICFVDWH